MSTLDSHRSSACQPEPEDDTLAARILSGDERAFTELMDRYWEPLVRYAGHLLKDYDAGADVVQESLAQLLLERERLRSVESLRGYLYRIVHTRALDHRRRRFRRLRLLREQYERTPAKTQSPPQEQEELPALLQDALDALPERRRRVFVLAHLHDLSYAEIAEVLQISPQTVANQVSRALTSLRSRLAPHADKLRPLR